MPSIRRIGRAVSIQILNIYEAPVHVYACAYACMYISSALLVAKERSIFINLGGRVSHCRALIARNRDDRDRGIPRSMWGNAWPGIYRFIRVHDRSDSLPDRLLQILTDRVLWI